MKTNRIELSGSADRPRLKIDGVEIQGIMDIDVSLGIANAKLSISISAKDLVFAGWIESDAEIEGVR